ncbi:MAG: tyrosine-type recombinase/integrase [Anaerolineae bacterium]|nr:tyrosine-type recombinase/integrase [Anaerolineae bacterium]
MKPQSRLIKSNGRSATSLAFWRDDYLNSKRVKLEKSTLRNYRQAINLYINYVGEAHWPPTRFDVIQFLDDVKARASQKTTFSYWVILRGWFGYIAKLGGFDIVPNPAQQIEELELAPKNPRVKPKGIPKKHIDTLLTYLRRSSDKLVDARDLTLLHFLYRTGARAGEVARLNLEMLHIDSNRVCIPAEDVKGDEDREFYFGEKVKADLRKWLDILHDQGYKEMWIFPSTRGEKLLQRPLTVSGIYQMFHRRLEQVGLPMYCIHDLRHTFTKEAMRQAKSLASIQKQLGHSSPDMVLWYAKCFSQEHEQDFINFGDE